ncbi:hypothetical protein [Streptomyces lincolnensis]|uniref:hypothetical protein n=1 Tax=Streptomyces lincolnensis TaxID=1915 RepID=UPI0035AB7B38
MSRAATAKPLRRLLWRPGELGLARTWVAGDLEVDGDLYELLKRISTPLWEREESGSRTAALRGAPQSSSGAVPTHATG